MNKLMKTLAIGTAAAMMAMNFAGCGGKTTTSASSSASSAATTTTQAAANVKTITSGKLIMGTNAEFPPFEYMDGGSVVGIDASIMQEVAKRLGLTLEIQNMKFESLSSALKGKTIDCIAAGFTVTPDRQEEMDFTDSYYTAKQTIIVSSTSSIKTKDDLKGKKVGAQTGTTGESDAGDVIGKDKVVGYDSGALAVQALLSGQVDAVIIDDTPANEYKTQQGDKISLIENQFDPEEYGVAVCKGNTDLQKAINGALKDMKSDGTLQKIIDQFKNKF